MISNRLLLACLGTVMLIFLFYSASVNATLDSVTITHNETPLSEGKYLFFVSESVGVAQFLEANPEIMAVSYYDSINDKTVGYVRAFGGIGKSFIMTPGVPYEVYLNMSASVRIPA